MVKSPFVILLLVFTSTHSWNTVLMPDFGADYVVISDVKDNRIRKGRFILEGEVRQSQTGSKMSGVSFGFLESENRTSTDSSGSFRLVGKTGIHSSFFLFKDGWAEFVLENYPFADQHRITITAYLHPEKVNQTVRKPVIYLYNSADINVSVKVNPVGRFTFTYPEYQEGWNICVHANGGLTDRSTGKNFPYLFWEAESENLKYLLSESKLEGFIIQTDTCIGFLENQLSQMGLNSTERTDFITFWGPILQKQPYAVIQFLLDDSYDQHVAELEAEPEPQTSRRIFMLYSPLHSNQIDIQVVPQQFSAFTRTGFTIVEWGGSEINFSVSKP